MIALFLAAAVSFPAPVHASINLDDASGLKAFFDAAGVYARSLSSAEVSHSLREQLAVDPLALKSSTIVFSRRGIGMVAPMETAKARAALLAWKRPNHLGLALKGKLYTASGRDAKALLKVLQHPKTLPAQGPIGLWFALAAPLKTATFTLQASAKGLNATGTVTASKPLLQGPSPAPCPAGAMGCFVGGLGPAGHELLERMLRFGGDLTPRAQPPQGTRVASRLDGLNVSALADRASLPDALLFALAFDAPGWPADAQCGTPRDVDVLTNPRCAPSSPLTGTTPGAQLSLDLSQVAGAFSRLTALDALKGEGAATGYGIGLIYGELLRHLGPLTMNAVPSQNDAAAAELKLQLPLH
ncbi:MAG TPA: hypothetical protein VGH20_00550 [Myxococcales bacterium]